MDVCRRGYRGVFWSNLVSGKCARGRELVDKRIEFVVLVRDIEVE